MLPDLEKWAPIVSDLFTPVAIFIAALQLKKESARHLENRVKEQEDRMRVAAAGSLAKLERRRKAYIDYFTRVKPYFIDVSERRPRSKNWETERDYLWKKSEEAEASLLSELMEEKIESDYVELAGLYSELFGDIRGAVEVLDAMGTSCILDFRRNTGKAIQTVQPSESTSYLSSALRDVAETHADQFARKSGILLEGISLKILELIENSERPQKGGIRWLILRLWALARHRGERMGQRAARTPDEYLQSLPGDRREVVAAVRDVILRHLPDGYTETASGGMITYGVPLECFTNTYNQQSLGYVALASQKNHIALYMMGTYGDPAQAKWIEEGFARAGKKLNMDKSCIRFRKIDDLPLEVIGEAVARMIPKELMARGTTRLIRPS